MGNTRISLDSHADVVVVIVVSFTAWAAKRLLGKELAGKIVVKGRHDVRGTENDCWIHKAKGKCSVSGFPVLGVEELDTGKSSVSEAARVGLIAREPADPEEVDGAPRVVCRAWTRILDVGMEYPHHSGIGVGKVVLVVLA